MTFWNLKYWKRVICLLEGCKTEYVGTDITIWTTDDGKTHCTRLDLYRCKRCPAKMTVESPCTAEGWR